MAGTASSEGTEAVTASSESTEAAIALSGSTAAAAASSESQDGPVGLKQSTQFSGLKSRDRPVGLEQSTQFSSGIVTGPTRSELILQVEQAEVDTDAIVWGHEQPIPPSNFADDPLEDRENPYIFKEKTTPLDLDLGRAVDVGMQLDEDAKSKVKEALLAYMDVFAFNGELGDCNCFPHSIRTGDSKPISSPPYARSRTEREAVNQQVQDWLAKGVIRPSRSPWASRVVTVLKKDNTRRCCIDYRGLNSVTVRDVYPLPTKEEIFENMNGMCFFSTLDLNQGYLQIRMDAADVPKTAFIVQGGLFEFLRMPFGLTNAPATFQRAMNDILAGLLWTACLVYLDDIIIFGRTLNEMTSNLEKVLQRLREAQLTIKPSKCAFAVDKVKFLGHILSGDGLQMDPEKVKSIVDTGVPTDLAAVRSFVGLASFYRQFVKDFSLIAEPLTRLTRKNIRFEWTAEQQQAYERLKGELVKEPIMCHHDPSRFIELRTDASDKGLGAVLLHEFEPVNEGGRPVMRVIAYASRQLKGYELNYGVTEKECLAIVWACEKFDMYLQGRKFRVVTDHLALTWLNSKKDLQGRLMRWANKLQPYYFEVIYKSGKQHLDADFLSRYPVQTEKVIDVNWIRYGRRGTTNLRDADFPEAEDEHTEYIPLVDLDKIKEAQASDTKCREVTEHLDRYSGKFDLEDGLLIYVDRHDTRAESVAKPVIPDSVLHDVLYGLHDDPLSSHCGFRKTLWKFQQRFFAFKSHTKIKHYVHSCMNCQTKKDQWTRKLGLMHPLTPTTRPFQRVGIDTLGPFRKSFNGNQKIIVATDYHSRYAIVLPVRKENSEVIASMIIHEIILKYGAPSIILTDRGKSFQTDLIKQVYAEFGVNHVTSTAYHPQTNGLVERFNKTLSTMLSMYVRRDHRDWDKYLAHAVFAYNTTVQDSTGYSPFYLMHGYEAKMPLDATDPNPEQSLSDHFERLQEARERAVEATLKTQQVQKQQYDRGRRVVLYQAGEKVWLYRPRGHIGQTTKLRHPYEGPYEILRVLDRSNYELNITGPRPRLEIVHVSRLKKYVQRRSLS